MLQVFQTQGSRYSFILPLSSFAIMEGTASFITGAAGVGGHCQRFLQSCCLFNTANHPVWNLLPKSVVAWPMSQHCAVIGTHSTNHSPCHVRKINWQSPPPPLLSHDCSSILWVISGPPTLSDYSWDQTFLPILCEFHQKDWQTYSDQSVNTCSFLLP